MNQNAYMSRDRSLIITTLVLIALLGILGTWGREDQKEVPAMLQQGTFLLGEAILRVEIAETPEARTQGLSGRDRLAADHGMLFAFPEPVQGTFWMKGMKFPLDFVWIREGRVIGLTEQVVPDGGETVYFSPEPVDAVLEINAGEAARYGIEVGNEATLRP